MYYIFTEFASGGKALFTTSEKLKEFVKEYAEAIYDMEEAFPVLGEDYDITEVKADIEFTEFWGM